MTTIPNWLLTMLFLLGCWGALIALFMLGIAVWEWVDTLIKEREKRRAEQERDKEYEQLYQFGITYLQKIDEYEDV